MQPRRHFRHFPRNPKFIPYVNFFTSFTSFSTSNTLISNISRLILIFSTVSYISFILIIILNIIITSSPSFSASFPSFFATNAVNINCLYDADDRKFFLAEPLATLPLQLNIPFSGRINAEDANEKKFGKEVGNDGNSEDFGANFEERFGKSEKLMKGSGNSKEKDGIKFANVAKMTKMKDLERPKGWITTDQRSTFTRMKMFPPEIFTNVGGILEHIQFINDEENVLHHADENLKRKFRQSSKFFSKNSKSKVSSNVKSNVIIDFTDDDGNEIEFFLWKENHGKKLFATFLEIESFNVEFEFGSKIKFTLLFDFTRSMWLFIDQTNAGSKAHWLTQDYEEMMWKILFIKHVKYSKENELKIILPEVVRDLYMMLKTENWSLLSSGNWI